MTDPVERSPVEWRVFLLVRPGRHRGSGAEGTEEAAEAVRGLALSLPTILGAAVTTGYRDLLFTALELADGQVKSEALR
jgi:hypothetical protein